MSQQFKPTVLKVSGIPVAVVCKEDGRKWELKPNPHAGIKVGDPPGIPLSFVASAVEEPTVEWEGAELAGRIPPRQFDGLKLRESFMELRREEQFLKFLNQVGRFSWLDKFERQQGWQLRDLSAFQKFFTQLTLRSPATWSDYADSLMTPESGVGLGLLGAIRRAGGYTLRFQWQGAPQVLWRHSNHLAVIETADAVSAIVATIQIDHLRGAKFGACALGDCNNFFEITSRHNRMFCSGKCAHHATVRRHRDPQNPERKATGAKKTKRRS